MQRRGMMVGSGRKGYYNVIGKDPMVHSLSARGIKQPQRVAMMARGFKPQYRSKFLKLAEKHDDPMDAYVAMFKKGGKLTIGKELIMSKKPLKVGDKWAYWTDEGYRIVTIRDLSETTAQSNFATVIDDATGQEKIVDIYKLHEVKGQINMKKLRPYQKILGGKTQAKVRLEGNRLILKSYYTDVAYIENGRPVVTSTYSPTTLRHIMTFLRDNGFKAESRKQILKDYAPTKEDMEKIEQEQKEKAESMMKSVAMVASIGEFFGDTEKEKNDWKLRMLKAGLEPKGLQIPDDWNTLSEAEKKKRLDKVIQIAKGGKLGGYDDRERRMWVENDEGLYRWRLSENKSVYPFVKEHRKEIDDFIDKQLGRK